MAASAFHCCHSLLCLLKWRSDLRTSWGTRLSVFLSPPLESYRSHFFSSASGGAIRRRLPGDLNSLAASFLLPLLFLCYLLVASVALSYEAFKDGRRDDGDPGVGCEPELGVRASGAALLRGPEPAQLVQPTADARAQEAQQHRGQAVGPRAQQAAQTKGLSADICTCHAHMASVSSLFYHLHSSVASICLPCASPRVCKCACSLSPGVFLHTHCWLLFSADSSIDSPRGGDGEWKVVWSLTCLDSCPGKDNNSFSFYCHLVGPGAHCITAPMSHSKKQSACECRLFFIFFTRLEVIHQIKIHCQWMRKEEMPQLFPFVLPACWQFFFPASLFLGVITSVSLNRAASVVFLLLQH